MKMADRFEASIGRFTSCLERVNHCVLTNNGVLETTTVLDCYATTSVAVYFTRYWEWSVSEFSIWDKLTEVIY